MSKDSRLEELCMRIPEKAFAGLLVMTVADLLQLPPIRGKLVTSQFSVKGSIKHLLCLQIRHLFKYAQLTGVVSQNHKLSINLFNKIRVGNIDDDLEKLPKVRLTHEPDENYPKDALHIIPRVNQQKE